MMYSFVWDIFAWFIWLINSLYDETFFIVVLSDELFFRVFFNFFISVLSSLFSCIFDSCSKLFVFDWVFVVILFVVGVSVIFSCVWAYVVFIDIINIIIYLSFF